MINKVMLAITVMLAVLLPSVSYAEEDGEPTFKTQYIEMKPSFVTNYGGPAKKKLKYVKADISLRVKTKASAAAVDAHMPYLRNEVVFLLSGQSEKAMSNVIAQEEVRKSALEAINKILAEEAGDDIRVDDLLFTNFVVQR